MTMRHGERYDERRHAAIIIQPKELQRNNRGIRLEKKRKKDVDSTTLFEFPLADSEESLFDYLARRGPPG